MSVCPPILTSVLPSKEFRNITGVSECFLPAQFAKEIYPGQFEPSLGHMFIKELENHGKLLRNFTQNIDTIELTAGKTRLLSFPTRSRSLTLSLVGSFK